MWFPVALAEHILADKPYPVQVADQGIVLFRDNLGNICALEDRCPHRRVPLSLGKIIDGHIRCAYHGWTFEGEQGRCVNIPNLAEGERIAPSLGADAFSVKEHEGFIYLAAYGSVESPLDTNGQDVSHSTTLSLPTVLPLNIPTALKQAQHQSGSAVITLDVNEYLAALLDGPHVLLGIQATCITDFFLGDVVMQDGTLTLDRTAIWSHNVKPHEKAWGKSGLLLRTELYPEQSAARLQLLDVGDRPLVSVLLAMVPGKRGTTQVHWRCDWQPDYAATAPLGVRLRNWKVRCPFQLVSAVNADALADLLPGPSLYLAGKSMDTLYAAQTSPLTTSKTSIQPEVVA